MVSLRLVAKWSRSAAGKARYPHLPYTCSTPAPLASQLPTNHRSNRAATGRKQGAQATAYHVASSRPADSYSQDRPATWHTPYFATATSCYSLRPHQPVLVQAHVLVQAPVRFQAPSSSLGPRLDGAPHGQNTPVSPTRLHRIHGLH
ncbi:hypothetical protein HYQ44_006096 [Verticillium longisporum]|nr:hypothetical protein HYQ44_006096 [Verticillium longisporum]